MSKQRQQLARSLSGMSLNSSAHSDDAINHQVTHSSKKRSMRLAKINSAYRSNVNSFREAIKPDLSSDRLSASPVRNRELVDGVDSSDQLVGGGPAVSTQDKRRDSGRGIGGDEKVDVLDASKDKGHIRSTSPSPLVKQGSKVLTLSRRIPSSKVSSNKSISITKRLDVGEETRAPTNTTDKVKDKVAPTALSPRKVSRPTAATYTGRSIYTYLQPHPVSYTPSFTFVVALPAPPTPLLPNVSFVLPFFRPSDLDLYDCMNHLSQPMQNRSSLSRLGGR